MRRRGADLAFAVVVTAPLGLGLLAAGGLREAGL